MKEGPEIIDYLILMSIAFALLCIPKDYGIIRGEISVAVLINPLIILTVLSVLIYQGCRESKFAFKGLRGGA